MNYSRRPNRPDGNVYREMRRQKFRKPRDVGRGEHRRRGSMLLSVSAIVLLGCAVVVAWVFWH